MEALKEVSFKCKLGQHDVDGVVVNPGEWFGIVWLIQIGISNNLNPFYAVEARNEQHAIDVFADSRFSHLIDVDVEDDNDEYPSAGNDGHKVDLDNVHIQPAPKDLMYVVEWCPKQDGLSTAIDNELETVRAE